MSSPPPISLSTSDEGPKFARVEHSVGTRSASTAAKFSVSNPERNVESLAAININNNTSTSGSKKKETKKAGSLKRGIFSGIFRKKTKKMLFGEPIGNAETKIVQSRRRGSFD